MLIPILNVAAGVALAVGGATGQLTFIGTSSHAALVAAGAVIAGLGIIQMVRAAKGR